MNKLVGIFLVGAVTLGTTAVAPAAPEVYIPLGTANEILVVDAADDEVIGAPLRGWSAVAVVLGPSRDGADITAMAGSLEPQ